jgi:hypothetical protein
MGRRCLRLIFFHYFDKNKTELKKQTDKSVRNGSGSVGERKRHGRHCFMLGIEHKVLEYLQFWPPRFCDGIRMNKDVLEC